MSKVIAFMGSPRKNGYTAQLIEYVLNGARDEGAEIVIYRLNDEGIKGCQGCFYCREHADCATKDKLYPMYEDIKTADGIIAGLPIYFGDVSGQAKLWLNRLYPMLDVHFSPRYPGKKIVSVYAQANTNPELFQDAITKTNDYFKLCGWNLLDTFLIYGDVSPNYALPQELIDQAYIAGKQLAQKLE